MPSRDARGRIVILGEDVGVATTAASPAPPEIEVSLRPPVPRALAPQSLPRHEPPAPAPQPHGPPPPFSGPRPAAPAAPAFSDPPSAPPAAPTFSGPPPPPALPHVRPVAPRPLPVDDLAGANAPIGRRFLALLVDNAIRFVLGFILGFVALRILAKILTSASPRTGLTELLVTLLILIAVGALIDLLYAVPMMARRGGQNGQTFGHQLLGLRVVKLDGSPITASSAFAREGVIKVALFGWASFLLLGIPYLVNAVWPLFDSDQEALHDKICHTRVVIA